jgi:hypothetical protein
VKEGQSETASIPDPVTFLDVTATSRLAGILQADCYNGVEPLFDPKTKVLPITPASGGGCPLMTPRFSSTSRNWFP